MQKFSDWLMVHGASYSTARNYACRMVKVLAQIPEESLSKELLEAFLLKLQSTNKAATVNGYLNAIRSYLKFIKKEIELPCALKEPKNLPESFDENYLDNTIIPTISQLFSKDYLKFKALFYFLFFGGCRVSELDTLLRKHIDMTKKTAKIYMQKTRTERIIFFNDKTKEALEEYFNYDPEKLNAFNINSLNIKMRTQRIKEYFLEINFHIHIFRHSFATNLLRKGVDLLSVSKLLGHKNINSTMRYLGLTTDEMQDIYNKKIK